MAEAEVAVNLSLSFTTTTEKYLQILILPILDSFQDDMRKLPHKYMISLHH